VVRKIGLILAIFFGVPFLVLFVILLALYSSLPSPKALKNWKPPEATVIYDHKGRPFGDIALQRRYYVTLDKIPAHTRYAFISAEDKNFYRHFGVDPIAILRALIINIRSKDIKQGGSTITQQLARNLFLTPERSLTRKIKEAL
jgi:penicillin-binding protein 1A